MGLIFLSMAISSCCDNDPKPLPPIPMPVSETGMKAPEPSISTMGHLSSASLTSKKDVGKKSIYSKAR